MYFDTTEKYLLFVQELRYTIDRLERENNQKKEIINQVYVYKFFREINSKKCLKQFFPWNWCSWYNCDAMGSLTRPTPFGAIYLPISDFSVRRPILPYNITYLRTLYHLMIYQGVQVTPRTVHLIIMIWYKNISSTYPWDWHWIFGFFFSCNHDVIYSTWLPIIGQKWTGILEIQSRRFADTIGRIKNQNEGFRAGT